MDSAGQMGRGEKASQVKWLLREVMKEEKWKRDCAGQKSGRSKAMGVGHCWDIPGTYKSEWHMNTRKAGWGARTRNGCFLTGLP